MIKVSLSGIKGLEKALKGKSEALVKGVDAEMQSSIATINGEQKARAPIDDGFLRSSLKIVPNLPPLHKAVVSEGAGSSYAPYQEFGTGGYVFYGQPWVDAELESEASKFKGKGIRKVNIYPQPFFFAPAFAEWDKLKKRIENMLKK
jgi:hypothetical protein